MADASPPPYRWAAFTHGLNLAFLLAAGIGGVYEPNIWAMAIPIEAAILWIIPDLPPFRLVVDRRANATAVYDERSLFLKQVWGLHDRPKPAGLARLKSLFVEDAADNPDDRVIARKSREFASYLEMRAIVDRLRELAGMRGVHFTELEVQRCEQVINGYLRLLIACHPLAKAVEGGDIEAIDESIADVDDRLLEADGPVRTALSERRQLLMQHRERVPRLEATLELFRARADAIVQQLRNIHGQVLADPGMNVNAMLDEVMVRQEAITDPLQQAAADQSVAEFIRRTDKLMGKGARGVEDSEADAGPRRPRGRQRA